MALPAILHTSPTLPVWNSPVWKMVIEWRIGDRIVRLLQYENSFQYESVVDGKIFRGVVPYPEDWKPEEAIAEIAERQPYIYDDGTVEFLEKGTAQSQLNSAVTIDEGNWCITIADLGQSALGRITTWGGHAAVIIETIEEGTYKMWKGHLLRGDNELAKVSFQPTSFDRLCHRGDGSILPEDFPRTETWVRTKLLVQKMMRQMSLEADRSRRGEPIGFSSKGEPIKFCAPGGDTSETRDYLTNCIRWVRERAYLADIMIPRRIKIFSVVELPLLYMGPPARRIVHEVGTGVALGTFAAVATPIINYLGAAGVISGATVAAPVTFMVAATVSLWGLVGLGTSFLERLDDKRQLEKFKEGITRPDS